MVICVFDRPHRSDVDTRNLHVSSSCNLQLYQLLYPPAARRMPNLACAHEPRAPRAGGSGKPHGAYSDRYPVTRYTGVDTVNRAR